MQSLPAPLAPLAAYRQFMGYKLVPNERTGKMDKKPVSVATGWVADPTDPAGWGTFEQAAALRVSGVAFVFTEHDPFWFLDIDGALQGGAWSPLAQRLIDLTAGCAIEVSQSGTGLHIIGSGPLPEHGCKNVPFGLELYHWGRIVALTGHQASGSVAHDPGDAVRAQLVAGYFPPSEASDPDADWTDGPCEGWDGHTDDAALIEHASRAGSKAAAFGANRATFADLWEGRADVLAACYPSQTGDDWDRSSADAALAQHLAFWTGKDCERIERLMWASALVREKWTDREAYMRGTVLRACSLQRDVHQRQKPAATGGAEVTAGWQLIYPDKQPGFFAGCVYVRDLHRVFVPDGGLLKPEQFKVAYGGFTFMLDNEGRKTTRSPWEAFTESQAVRHPHVHATMFRPDLEPGALFEHHGRKYVNCYVPVPVRRAQGDASPFLDYLAKLLPDHRDREILLAYMAACVQHKGVKFQWWPLIQGVEGNGKTLLSRVVAEAIGMPHTATPRAEEISNKFNSWIKDKAFVYVEDVYYPDHKREVVEALKPIITNSWLPVEPKGVDQATAYVCANGMLNSNHRDAVKKTRNDRRFCFFYTAQQQDSDLQRDGMDGPYFPRLYRWLNADGYAIVAEFLHTYPIPADLNPAGDCHRAPHTTSTEAAIAESLGAVEQEVAEAIEQGQPGFAGGWVSSMALDRLLERIKAGRRVPPSKRRELMRSLGYDWHPGLNQGRVNNMIPLDGGKPKLFIRMGHIHANLTSPAEIVRHYTEAQNFSGALVDTKENKA